LLLEGFKKRVGAEIPQPAAGGLSYGFLFGPKVARSIDM
jgi:hypothetical protein